MALIEVINDSGTVLIDDNYSNAVVAAKGALTLTAGNAGSGDAYLATITYTSGDVLTLGVELNDIRVIHLTTNRSGNTWTFTLLYNKAFLGRTLTYYLFTIPSIIGGAGGILQLFNAAGQLVFDSNMKYMKVKGFYATKLDNATLASDLEASRTYAVISVMACFYHQHIFRTPGGGGGAPPYEFIDVSATSHLSRSGNSFISTRSTHDSGIRNADSTDTYVRTISDGRALLIDVTNF